MKGGKKVAKKDKQRRYRQEKVPKHAQQLKKCVSGNSLTLALTTSCKMSLQHIMISGRILLESLGLATFTISGNLSFQR